MELKDQVQGVVIGLFGAYAGGYFADLTSQAETGNPVALVEGLVNLQTPLLGVNLSDDAAWVDTILGHLGVSSTSAAYTAAAAWANGELDAGASRAEVVLAAVTYLLGDSVEAQYASVATAFKADVAAGVVYSEGEGAEVLAIGDLREAAGNPATGTSFNLTAALASLNAANSAFDSAVEAWGLAQNPVQKDLTGADAALVYAAVDTAEAAVATKYAALSLTAVSGIDTAEPDTATGYDDADATEALAVSTAKNHIATQKAFLTGDLANKTAALTAGAKVKIDAYLASVKAADDASKAEAAALLASNSEAAKLAVASGLDSWYSYDGSVTDTDGYVALVNIYDGSTNIVLFVNKAGDVRWYDYADVGSGASTDPADAYTVVPDAVKGVDISAAIAASLAYQAAVKATVTADDKVVAALAAVEAVDASYIDGSVLTGGADAYADAQKAIVDFDKLVAEFDAAVAAAAAARAAAATVAAADKAAEAAADALTAAGWNLQVIGTDNAGAGNDVFLFDGKTGSIANFGVDGNDVIAFGAGKYSLVTVASADVGVKAIGNSSVLEIFVVDTGANTVLYVEKNAFDGSSVAAQDNLVMITLTGVADATAVALTGSGYLSA